MDHIPLPSSPVRAPLKVPFLCTSKYAYDNLGFASYPTRAGVDISGATSVDELAAFLQAWLYFGTLQEVFENISGVPFTREDFLTEQEDGQRVITTENLQRYIWYWIASEVRLKGPDDEDENLVRLERTTECLARVNEVVHSLGYVEAAELDLVLLSIVLLAEALDKARPHVYAVYKVKTFTWDVGGFVKKLLQEAGWCLGEVAMLGINTPSVIVFVSFLDRKGLGKDHSKCSDVSCVANQIDEDTYVTRHARESYLTKLGERVTSSGCGCEHIVVESPASHPVSAILKAGGIPVISVAAITSDSSAPIVSITAADPSKPYVAISHVWSDGMGNPRQNALPLCQLQKLQKLVNGLYEPENHPVPFWIDTICVPLSNDMRNMAIQLMARTYEGAGKVLVLDSSLTDPGVHSAPEELLMRIRCSSWMQRLWTLQEGMLADELYFLVGDGTVRVSVLDAQFREVNSVTKNRLRLVGAPDFGANDVFTVKIHRALAADDVFIGDDVEAMEYALQTVGEYPDCPDYDDEMLMQRLETYNDYANQIFVSATTQIIPIRLTMPRMRGERGLELVAASLKGRMSSKMADETICVSALLGKSPKKLLQIPGHDPLVRMKAFWASLSTVSPNIIFANSPRLQEDGFRWAPATFMTNEVDYGSRFFSVGITARISPEGLAFSQFISYFIAEDREDLGEVFDMAQEGSELVFRVRVLGPRADRIRRPALIVENPPATNPMTRGVLVSLRSESAAGSAVARFENRVVVEATLDRASVNGNTVVGTVRQSVDLQWCVG